MSIKPEAMAGSAPAVRGELGFFVFWNLQPRVADVSESNERHASWISALQSSQLSDDWFKEAVRHQSMVAMIAATATTAARTP